MNLRKHLESARQKLADYPAAQLEAEILLAHSLQSPRSFLYANPELDIPRKHYQAFKKLVQRRVRGEPIAYITAKREFWSLLLKITPDVLIPRHETELLVEAALQRIPSGEVWRIADLGTGSSSQPLSFNLDSLCAVMARIALSGSLPGVSACPGSKRQSPCCKYGSSCAM